MSRGFVVFAINNEKVNYIKLAIICSAFIKKQMPLENICLITDKYSYNADLKQYFTDIIIIEENSDVKNTRRYFDTQYYNVEAEFKNLSRNSVYALSPYDETILIDSDYLVCSKILSNCWGSSADLMIAKSADDLLNGSLTGPEFRLNDYSIRMYWATVIYFKKCDSNKLLFDLVEHIKNEWEFYKLVYGFPGHLFRNDYAFSIAIHILNGFSDINNIAADLPLKSIKSVLDKDQLYLIKNLETLVFYYQDRKESWKYNLVSLEGVDVHCMNKLSILNKFDQIMELSNE